MLNTSPAVGTVAADTMEVRFAGDCFGCGPLNLEGLRLTFVPGPDGSGAEFEVPDRFQSWAGMAHGGVVAPMLDEAVGSSGGQGGRPGGTAEGGLPPAAEAGRTGPDRGQGREGQTHAGLCICSG